MIEIDNEEFLELWKKKLTIKKLSEHFNCSSGPIHRKMKELGLKSRTASDYLYRTGEPVPRVRPTPRVPKEEPKEEPVVETPNKRKIGW